MRISGPVPSGPPPLSAGRSGGAGATRRAGSAAEAGGAPAPEVAASSSGTDGSAAVAEVSPLERAARQAPATQAVAAENRRAADSVQGEGFEAERVPG